MAVELCVLQLAGTRVVEDREVALVDVLAKARAAPFHLLVEDGAAQRANENDVLYVRRVETGRQQINGDGDTRIARADDGEIALQLVAVPLGAGDPRCVVGISGQSAQLLRHEGRVSIIDAEDDAFLVTKLVLAENLPKILGNRLGSIRHANFAFEIRCRITFAIRAGEAILIDVGDALFEQIGYQIAVFDGLLEAVGEDRVTEVVLSIAPSFFSSQRAITFFEFARRRRQAKLERSAEVLQNAEPVAKPGPVAFVDDDEIEKIRIVVLVELSCRRGLRRDSGNWRRRSCRPGAAPWRPRPCRSARARRPSRRRRRGRPGP